MNIEKVYLCDIYVMENLECKKINVNVDRVNGFNYDSITSVKCKTTFVKKALVYYSVLNGYYVDLETKEKYKFGYGAASTGDLFVDIKRKKVYGKEIMGSQKKHYSKKKVLKRYDEYKENYINKHE